MKTKRLILTALVAGSTAFLACGGGGHQEQEQAAEEVATEESADEAVTREAMINTGNSTVGWSAEMLGMYTHTGTVNLTDASLLMQGDQISGGSFTVDLSTITATDENFNPEQGSTKEKLVGHLSSDAFFDVANFPTATYEISGSNGNEVMGTLTIRGVSKEVSVTDVSMTDGGVTGNMTFNRKDFGVSFDMDMQDMVISDDVKLNINLVL